MARAKPLADFLQPCLGRALAAQGFAAADILAAWPEIVGERLAQRTQPLRIDWPRGAAARDRDLKAEPATLVIQVESAFALELQHLAPVIMERVNAHYGWRCLGRIVLKQGPVRRGRPAKPVTPVLGESDRQRLSQVVGDVAEEGLREALARLGEAVIRSERGPGRTKA
jgi:hypothetical protein